MSNENTYLILGHITEDLTSEGKQSGGTAAYSGLTARAFGYSVKIITSFSHTLDPKLFAGIEIINIPTKKSTTFENITTANQRTQYIYENAADITKDSLPENWQNSQIIHFAPIANEIEKQVVSSMKHHQKYATPQGWMRSWDKNGLVNHKNWENILDFLPDLKAIVLSNEDIDQNEDIISSLVTNCDILALTEGKDGARIYWKGDVRFFPAPAVAVVDTTGAGDIFAAVFFSKLTQSNDPWLAGKFAVKLASLSVTRKGLESIPSQVEVKKAEIDIIREN